MEILTTLLLSLAVVSVAIVQFYNTKTYNDRFKDLYGDIKNMKKDIEKLKEQIEHNLDPSVGICSFEEPIYTVKGKAEFAKRCVEELDKKIELLENYLGIEAKEIPAKPAKVVYKPIKKENN